jgi:polynucleotide 5'-kinase involved in rRNA processing
MIALHFVYDPLLSLPHDHMQIPVRACFLGNVTVKAEPEMLTTSIQTLFEVYQQATTILSRCSIFGTAVVHDRLRKPSESSFIGEMNPGGTLTPYELERVLHMCEVCLEHHSFATQLQQTSLPLIVNTDGWLRSMGSDLLGYIIETIKPLVLAQLGISSRIPRPMFQIPENCR